MNKFKKYSYLGNVYPSCGSGWHDLLLEQLEKIDKEIYPKYLPRFTKKLWHWLHHKSPYKIRYIFQTKWHCYSIFQIKEKYGELRIYDCPVDIFDETMKLSWNTCEHCGNKDNLGTTQGWITRLCRTCANDFNINKLKWDEDE